MGLFFKRGPKKQSASIPVTEQRKRRLSRVSTADLPSWAEQATFEIGRCLVRMREEVDPVIFDDAILASETLTAILYEMKSRAVY